MVVVEFFAKPIPVGRADERQRLTHCLYVERPQRRLGLCRLEPLRIVG